VGVGVLLVLSATNILREREHTMRFNRSVITNRFVSFRKGKHTDTTRHVDMYPETVWENYGSHRAQARLDFDAECAFLTMTEKWAA
jgi:hypothetical protein